jgi:hypothetical protein
MMNHLTLEHDEPLSNFALKFNLRRYNKDVVKKVESGIECGVGADPEWGRAILVAPKLAY